MKFSLQLGKFSFQLGTRNSELGTSKSGLSPIQAWLRGENSLTQSQTSTLVSPLQQSIWVYTAVSALAQTVSSIPFRISRNDRSGETVLAKGPVVDLFNRPHPYFSRSRFWEFLVTWYCLRGETFILALDKSGAVRPIASSNRHSPFAIRHLLVLPPDRFRHIVEGFDLVGWRYTASPFSGPIGPMDLLPEEVIHDFLPNPYLFWRGLSPLSVALLAAQTDYASAQYMKGLMLNNADAGVIVRTDQQLSPEQREALLAALRQRKTSAGTADHPLLLWGGAEVIQPTLSSADLQFLENRKMNRQEICAAFFRIPQSLVGFTESANRSIAEAERLNFIENSIAPLCARLEAAVEPIVKCFGGDLVGWFDVDAHPILQQARRNRVETGAKLFAMGYPANAINQALNLGLPHLPWGEKGYLPATLQQVGETPQPEPKHQAVGVFERLREVISNQCSVINSENSAPLVPSVVSVPSVLSLPSSHRNGTLSSFSLLASVAILLALCACDLSAAPPSRNSKRATPNAEPAGELRGTNAFWYLEGQVRIFSIDWCGLTPGHTYELQSSGDGKTWRRRLRMVWASPDPAAYWRTQLPMLPPTPEGLTVPELFRLADTSVPLVPLVPSVPSPAPPPNH